jgi:hypothetical protein
MLLANKYPPGWKQRRRNDKEKPSKPATWKSKNHAYVVNLIDYEGTTRSSDGSNISPVSGLTLEQYK